MVILVMRLSLRVEWAHSLKEKRMVKRSLVDHLRRHHNVSVSEVDDQDKWQRLTLGLSAVTLDESTAQQLSEHLQDVIEDRTDAVLIDVWTDIIAGFDQEI